MESRHLDLASLSDDAYTEVKVVYTHLESMLPVLLVWFCFTALAVPNFVVNAPP